MLKKGHILLKKPNNDEKIRKTIFFGFLSGKYGKMSKNVKNDEKRVKYCWKGRKLLKNKKNNIFWIFQENMQKYREKWKIMKKGQKLLKKAKYDEKIRKTIVLDFFRKIWKNVKKSEKWWKMVTNCWKRTKSMKNKKNYIFWIFSGKYGKMSKKVRNDEKGSCIAEKGQNWWKMRKKIFFGFFQENMEKCRKKRKIMKKGHILLKKVKIFGK